MLHILLKNIPVASDRKSNPYEFKSNEKELSVSTEHFRGSLVLLKLDQRLFEPLL